MLSNPWIIAIVTSIIVWPITFGLSKLVNKFLSKKEFYERVQKANSDVISTLRMSISEGAIPKDEIIQALIASFSRKYQLELKDVYTTITIKEELIKELFETSFISLNKKLDLSEDLLNRPKEEVKLQEENSEVDVNRERLRYEEQRARSRSYTLFTGAIGIISIYSVLIGRNTSNLNSYFQDNLLFIPLLASLLASVVVTYVYSKIMKTAKKIKH